MQISTPARRYAARVPTSRNPHLCFQTLRHTGLARVARGLMYRALVGPSGWPLRFRAPDEVSAWGGGVSSHLYVHLPFCRQICPHCPYAKTLYTEARHRLYGAALEAELAAYLAREDAPSVQSLYFGGGTPTATPDLIERTIAQVSPRLTAGVEIGVEVHPADASPAMLARLRAAGVTRISLGIESLRPDLLRLLGRRYSPEEALSAISAAREAGFECVDVNLIFGIPGQTVDDPANDAARCLELGADQISAYQLFTFVHTPLGDRVRQGEFPVYGERARLKAQRRVARVCRASGIEQTSPWNFTRPGVAPYSTVTQEDYVGFGAGAGSKVDGAFWFNTFSVDEYSRAPGHGPALVMDVDERFRRAHWLYWRLYRLSVNEDEYETLFGRSLNRDFGLPLRALAATGMARREGRAWRVTGFGAVWMHRLQQLFSITYIDDLWERCQSEPWPQEVVLA
ncbi:MAG TPA: radical SAM protein [Armatimonadota bacterium]